MMNMRKQKGYISTEIAIGILVISVLVGTGIVIATRNLESSRHKQTAVYVDHAANQIQQAYRSEASFTGLTETLVASMGVFPTFMVNGDNVTTREGVGMVVALNNCDLDSNAATTNECFDITISYNSLPAAESAQVCVDFTVVLTQLSNQIVQVNVNSKNVLNGDFGDLLPGTLGTECNADADVTVRYPIL